MTTGNQSLQFGDYTVTIVVSDPPWYQNCFIVQKGQGGEQVVIDPGAEPSRVVEQIEANGGKATDVLLTHGHPDHISGVRGGQDALDIPCHAHPDEKPVLDQATSMAAMMMGMQLQAPKDLQYFDADAPLNVLGDEVRVIHTPGHTPGGVCFVFDGFAFTGDTLFNHGVGRTDLPGGNGQTLFASITRFLSEVPDDTVLFSGHGPHWTAGEASQWWKQAF